MFGYLQEAQPVHITGAIRHCGLWLTSTRENIVKINPRFKAGSPETVIYCVHGTADFNNAFSLIADRIMDRLPETVSSIHLLAFGNRFQGYGVESFSEQLRAMILKNAHKNVILMGHSRGGLVCSYFAEFMADPAGIHVEKVISIGTPFMGSEMANQPLAFFSESVSQMQPNSHFLQRLAARMQTTINKYYYFAAEKDLLVSLKSTVIPEHSDALTVIDRHGHLSVMSSHRLANHIAHILQGIRPQLSLKTACKELDLYLQTLQNRGHLSDSQQKIILLQRLQTCLQSIDADFLDTRIKTIGDFIDQFWKDPRQGGGQKPWEILNTPLNFPFSVLQPHNTSTFNFVCGLKLKYQNVALKIEDRPVFFESSESSEEKSDTLQNFFPNATLNIETESSEEDSEASQNFFPFDAWGVAG